VPNDHPIPLEQYVYRAISPGNWDTVTGKAAPVGFQLRPSEINEGLSLFRADFITPRQLLQSFIDERTDTYTRQNKPKDLRRWLARNGSTPDEMYQKQWRIARLPICLFSDHGFPPDPVEEDGHILIRGTESGIVLLSTKIAPQANLVDLN
jgi:hypothetical protein